MVRSYITFAPSHDIILNTNQTSSTVALFAHNIVADSQYTKAKIQSWDEIDKCKSPLSFIKIHKLGSFQQKDREPSLYL